MWLNVVEATLSASSMEVVGTATTVKKAIAVALAVRPDVMVVDLQLPDGTGADVVAGVLKGLPGTKALMLSASGEARDALKATKAGASGYLLKSASDAELVAGVRATLEGKAVFSPALANLVLGSMKKVKEENALSAREVEVLRMVAKGLTSKQIASDLFLSPRTVENHIQSTLRKLQLHNRVELTRYALENLDD
jgi:DNA-binding NarL/FixJ family response regulator